MNQKKVKKLRKNLKGLPETSYTEETTTHPIGETGHTLFHGGFKRVGVGKNSREVQQPIRLNPACLKAKLKEAKRCG